MVGNVIHHGAPHIFADARPAQLSETAALRLYTLGRGGLYEDA